MYNVHIHIYTEFHTRFFVGGNQIIYVGNTVCGVHCPLEGKGGMFADPTRKFLKFRSSEVAFGAQKAGS